VRDSRLPGEPHAQAVERARLNRPTDGERGEEETASTSPPASPITDCDAG
jgi:hypothetical protein